MTSRMRSGGGDGSRFRQRACVDGIATGGSAPGWPSLPERPDCRSGHPDGPAPRPACPALIGIGHLPPGLQQHAAMGGVVLSRSLAHPHDIQDRPVFGLPEVDFGYESLRPLAQGKAAGASGRERRPGLGAPCSLASPKRENPAWQPLRRNAPTPRCLQAGASSSPPRLPPRPCRLRAPPSQIPARCGSDGWSHSPAPALPPASASTAACASPSTRSTPPAASRAARSR